MISTIKVEKAACAGNDQDHLKSHILSDVYH